MEEVVATFRVLVQRTFFDLSLPPEIQDALPKSKFLAELNANLGRFVVDLLWSVPCTVLLVAVIYMATRRFKKQLHSALETLIVDHRFWPSRANGRKSSSVAIQTNISMETNAHWQQKVAENKHLKAVLRNMAQVRGFIPRAKLRAAESSIDEDRHTLENILAEKKSLLQDKISNLEKRLYVTHKRNEGLRESLAVMEKKSGFSRTDSDEYWTHWQQTKTKLCDAKNEVAVLRRRLRKVENVASADGSGEAGWTMPTITE